MTEPEAHAFPSWYKQEKTMNTTDKQITNLDVGYLPKMDINRNYAKLNPNNCAVKETTYDGLYVGVCCFFLKDGFTCERHGIVKVKP